MTTLITVSNSDGIVGRCDAKCHDATHPACNCICGGMNHGAGGEVAQENTNEMLLGERSVADWAKKNGIDPDAVKAYKASRTPTQGTLL